MRARRHRQISAFWRLSARSDHRVAVPDSRATGVNLSSSAHLAPPPVSSVEALYVFNVRFTTDGEACCLEPSHAEL